MFHADPKTGQEVHGLCSNYIADVKPGDELIMTGPAGTALLLDDNAWNKRIVCVSTGTSARVCLCMHQHSCTCAGPDAQAAAG
jgi:Na+-transporting NADH:ubiquinone oxidoreductase subunit NqrF